VETVVCCDLYRCADRRHRMPPLPIGMQENVRGRTRPCTERQDETKRRAATRAWVV
jgi:hypothetical protein